MVHKCGFSHNCKVIDMSGQGPNDAIFFYLEVQGRVVFGDREAKVKQGLM